MSRASESVMPSRERCDICGLSRPFAAGAGATAAAAGRGDGDSSGGGRSGASSALVGGDTGFKPLGSRVTDHCKQFSTEC